MGLIEAWAGEDFRLKVNAVDGRTDLNLRATIVNGNGSPVPVTAVNLSHQTVGIYDAPMALAAGQYYATYRNFFTPSRVTVDPYRWHEGDNIIIHPPDPAALGVAYDSTNDNLRLEASLARRGVPVPSAQLLTASWSVYDADDNLLFTVTDGDGSDGLGVFRGIQAAPGLAEDRLYYVRVQIITSFGTFNAHKGFMTTE